MKITTYRPPVKAVIMSIVLLIGWLTALHSQPTVFSGARWISVPYEENAGKRVCPVFALSFPVKATVRSATLSITALGLYEATLNGKRIGDGYFTPGFTNYTKRLPYQEYDVTELLKRRNALQVTVGEGWYRGVFRNRQTDTARNNYGTEAGLLVQLDIVFTDGRRESVVSDSNWLCAPGPIRYAELYDGECYDATYTIQNWQPARLLRHSKEMLTKQEMEPVRRQEVLRPVRILRTPKGEQVIDFGQNIAGWVQFTPGGKKGDTVRLYHAEVPDQQGNFYTGNLRTAKAADTYILNGESNQVYEPHFTYHGFRYVKVEGFTATMENCRAIAFYTDLKKTGTFACSDSLLNRLQQNIEWSLNSNFFEIPTDCPQRSERLGWGMDAQVFTRTASYLRDTRRFLGRWLKDLAGEQGANGGLPNFIPSSSPYQPQRGGVAGWGDAATIMPWALYEVYNDTSVLRQQYASMKAWVEYITSRSSGGLWKDGGYGDWYAMGDSTSLPFIDQCFWAHSTQLLIAAATVLQQDDDIVKYTELLSVIRSRFLQEYGAFGTRATQTQTAYILALQFDLLPESDRSRIAELLARAVERNGDRLATGFLGTPYLLNVLSRFGYTDLAYRVLLQQQFPSWLFSVKQGATTIWEKWDAIRPDGSVQATSFNHYGYGAVGQWLYEQVAGIQAAKPGYQAIRIKPLIGGGLTWARGSYRCDYGMISSAWSIQDGKLVLEVEIPPGTTAEVHLPGLPVRHAGPGRHLFTTTYTQQHE